MLAGWLDWLLELGERADFAGLRGARDAVIRQVAVIRAADAKLSDDGLLGLTLGPGAAGPRTRALGDVVAHWPEPGLEAVGVHPPCVRQLGICRGHQ